MKGSRFGLRVIIANVIFLVPVSALSQEEGARIEIRLTLGGEIVRGAERIQCNQGGGSASGSDAIISLAPGSVFQDEELLVSCGAGALDQSTLQCHLRRSICTSGIGAGLSALFGGEVGQYSCGWDIVKGAPQADDATQKNYGLFTSAGSEVVESAESLKDALQVLEQLKNAGICGSPATKPVQK